MSVSQKGKVISDEHKLNMRKPKSKANFTQKGKTLTEEHKLNMRKPKSEATKIKISEANKGKVLSDDHKRNIGLGSMKKCCVDGILYNSVTDASEILSIKYPTLCSRLKSPNFDTYYYVLI